MRIRLLAQPLASGTDLRDFFEEIGVNKTLTRLRAVVAWVKRSGLDRTQDHLRALRARGGTLELIVGISQGGATKQGLSLALDLFDSVHVFHDRSGRTFHPKFYVADGYNSACILIGSNNLTAGGVYYNYEAGAIIDLDLRDTDDRAFFEDCDRLIHDLRGDSAICIELNSRVLDQLISDKRYRIQDEDCPRKSGPRDAPENIDTEVDVDTGQLLSQKTPSLFGKSQLAKKTAPRFSKRTSDRTPTTGPPPTVPGASVNQPTFASSLGHRWHKKMSFSDAQQKARPNTKVTGHLKLTQAKHPIDHRVFFRTVLFESCDWQSEHTPRGAKEFTTAPFDVVIGGERFGTHHLKLDHAEYRVANQGNVPTWLHWGSALGQYLRNNSHVGDFVTIEDRDGLFYITISEDPFIT